MPHPPNVAYPPRPVPGSVADMDVIMKHCNFSAHKVRHSAVYRSFSLTLKIDSMYATVWRS